MRFHRVFCSAALLGATLIPLAAASSQTEKEQQAMKDEMMKKWMEVSTPGDSHKKMDDLVGTWDATVSTWMEGPGKPPTVTKGTSEQKWVLGGRFIQQEMKGEMMGMPFNGMGLMGYDNFNKKYTFVWVDNSSTQMSTSEGTIDPSGKVFTYYGKMDEPMTGEHGKTVKYVSRIVSKDKNVFEIHDLSIPEPNTKVMEIVYTRKK